VSRVFEALKKAERAVAAYAAGLNGSIDRPTPNGTSTENKPAENRPSDRGTALEIPRVAVAPTSGAILIPAGEAHSQAIEQYRQLRTKIIHDPIEPRLIGIMSGGSNDGKTTTAINLSLVLALPEDTNVLLVEADLRQPTFCRTLGFRSDRGLANLLLGEVKPQEAILQVDQQPNLYVLPAGTAKCNPAELFESTAWGEVCAEFRKRFRFVILDTPPVGMVAESDIILKSCDGVIVVVRIDSSDRVTVQRALDAVPKPRQIGVVINSASEWFLSKRYYGEQAYYGQPDSF
jgi:tyrosine-protein kinase Etk/Wzc